MRPRAIIFDLDGTLADTREIWGRAKDRLFAAMGRRRTPALEAACAGLRADEFTAAAHRLLAPAVPLPKCQRIMREELLRAYSELRPRAIAGAVELVRRLHDCAPMAVASGSPLVGIEAAVTHLGIRERFRLLLSSESLPRGKPAPDVFLAAARGLGAEPADCVVFEDSTVGVKAARAAGMRCIVRPDPRCPEAAPLAWRAVASWDEVSRELVCDQAR